MVDRGQAVMDEIKMMSPLVGLSKGPSRKDLRRRNYTVFVSSADILPKFDCRLLLALLPKSPHFTQKRSKLS